MDVGQTATATVTVEAAIGAVADDTGTVGVGRYVVSGAASDMQAALRSLVFTATPGQAPPGETVMTEFYLGG